MTGRLSRWPATLAVLAVTIVALGQCGGRGGGPETPESSGPAGPAGPAEKVEAIGKRLRPSVVARYPHDGDAFTQGLLWEGGRLYESTGQVGKSRLRRSDLETGEVELEWSLPEPLFGEGLALVGTGATRELIWLTWTAGRAFRFGLASFEPRGEFAYQGEGWGLALCEGELYRSDGTAVLWRHDPVTFDVLGRLEVRRGAAAVEHLNELECTPSGLLANVWQSDEIVRIDPRSGRVNATIDASGLLEPAERRFEGVLNGIAYRKETDTLLLTGKYWPWIFEVVLDEDRR